MSLPCKNSEIEDITLKIAASQEINFPVRGKLSQNCLIFDRISRENGKDGFRVSPGVPDNIFFKA